MSWNDGDCSVFDCNNEAYEKGKIPCPVTGKYVDDETEPEIGDDGEEVVNYNEDEHDR